MTPEFAIIKKMLETLAWCCKDAWKPGSDFSLRLREEIAKLDEEEPKTRPSCSCLVNFKEKDCECDCHLEWCCPITGDSPDCPCNCHKSHKRKFVYHEKPKPTREMPKVGEEWLRLDIDWKNGGLCLRQMYLFGEKINEIQWLSGNGWSLEDRPIAEEKLEKIKMILKEV